MSLNRLSAVEAVKSIADGVTSSEDLVKACLAQITATDEQLNAWAFVDPELALHQAREMDQIRSAGKPMGPLHGVPVAVGDTIDTAATPTRLGSSIHQARIPDTDATVVSRLREAGAVILGKTATSEFGVGAPGPSGNPHDPARTPGPGGAAAAVAAGHVPLAVDRQQGGEIILSASYCGVYGLNPGHGMISRSGAHRVSNTLDRITLAARSLEDTALLADALTGYDAADAATYARAKPNLTRGVHEDVPIEPNFVYFKLPYADHLSSDAVEAFAELIDAMQGRVEEVALPASYANIIDHRNIVLEYELSQNLAGELKAHAGEVSPALADALERGLAIDADRYAQSLAVIDSSNLFLGEILTEFDAIITPSSAGAAPTGLDQGCDTLFSAMFDFCGLPSLSLPLLADGQNLPIGTQLVAATEEDARLFRSARWLLTYLT